MSVRAKFWVSEIHHHGSYKSIGEASASITLLPVTADTDENKTWSKYTPSGKIEMLITNPAAIAQFELGREYFIDFTPA